MMYHYLHNVRYIIVNYMAKKNLHGSVQVHFAVSLYSGPINACLALLLGGNSMGALQVV